MTPKVYVLIPTKNRYDTLKFAVQTCLNQEYDNLEIIVSDNYSSDNTQNILSEISDPRLKYQRTDKPLPMIYSWEFALSAVKEEGFVHFMGDDNGLTFDAIQRVVNIANKTGHKIIHGQPIQYTWPNDQILNGFVSIPKGENIYVINSQSALKAAYGLTIGFDRMPTINASFIHTSIIEKAKTFFDGKYFIASNPDVCSSIVNAYFEKEYVFTEKPFMINGASVHSNGMQGGSKSKSGFVIDNINGGYEYHKLFPPSKSYYMNVYEAFAKVSDAFNKTADFYKLNYSKLYNKFKKDEYIKMKRFWLYDDLIKFALLNNINDSPIFLPEVNMPLSDPTMGKQKLIHDNGVMLSFYSEYISLNNVNEVSIFSSDIINNNELVKKRNINYYERIKRFIMYNIVLKTKRLNVE
jgi:glycosyltransferase involved in cell wall biosynthesis